MLTIGMLSYQSAASGRRPRPVSSKPRFRSRKMMRSTRTSEWRMTVGELARMISHLYVLVLALISRLILAEQDMRGKKAESSIS
jgi:hypothetical protein